MSAVVGMLLRRHRIAIIAWMSGLIVLAAVTVPSYAATYGTGAEREALVRGLRGDPGLALMYGELLGSSVGELFVWEIGTYLLVLGAVMAVLLGAAMTRGLEESGAVELLRGAGLAPRAALDAALAVLVLLALVLGAGTGGALVLSGIAAAEVPVGGAALVGALVALTTLAFGAIAAIAAQLRGDLRSARGIAFAVLAAAFAARVLADRADAEWLRWCTPLGWRDVVRPFADDRAWALAPLAVTCLALVLLARRLGDRRELGSALLPERAARERRLPVRGIDGWAWYEARGALLGWTVVVLGLAGLFASMTSSLMRTLRESASTAELLELLGGGGAAVGLEGVFVVFLVSFLALLALIAVVGLVLRWRGEEASGRLVAELAAGVPRWRSLGARAAVAIAAAVLLAVGIGLVVGLVAREQLGDDAALGWAFAAAIGQLPALVAAIGLAALLVAVLPRLAPLVWTVVVWTGTVAWLGGLLRLPEQLMRTGLLQHGPELAASGRPEWGECLAGAPLVLLGGGALCLAAALALVGRRDLRPA